MQKHRRLCSPNPEALQGNEPLVEGPERERLLSQVQRVQSEFHALTGTPYSKEHERRLIPRRARHHLDFLNQHTRILSIVHSLPDDILRRIFEECFEESTRNYAPRSFNEGTFNLYRPSSSPSHSLPRILCQVSRRWRDLSISTSLLWSDLGALCLKAKHRSDEGAAHLVQSLTTYLERSKARPIRFSLIYEWDFWYEESRTPDLLAGQWSIPTGTAKIFALLIDSSARWEDVDLEIYCEMAWSAFDGVKGRLDSLKRLTLNFDKVPKTQVSFNTPFDHFAVAPRLEYAECKFHEGWPDAQPTVIFPWTQLVEYHERMPLHIDGLLSVLTASPNRIRTLHCNAREGLGPMTIPDFRHEPLFEQTSLTHLSITIYHSSIEILRHCSFPSLTTLSATNMSSETTTFLSDIVYLIHNSGCHLNLTSLSIDCRAITWLSEQGVLTDILCLCPNIRDLRTNYIPPRDLWLLTLCEHPQTPFTIAGRQLETLTIEIPWLFGIDIDYLELDRMAKARDAMHQIGQTSRLSIVIEGPFSPILDSVSLGTGPLRYSRYHNCWAGLSGLGSLAETTTESQEKFARWAKTIRVRRCWLYELRSLKSRYYRQSWEIHKVLNEMKEYEFGDTNLVAPMVSLSRFSTFC